MARRDQRSPEAALYRALYKTARWRKMRAAQLARQPLCQHCQAQGRDVAATVANHVIPHRGDMKLFWDETNLGSECKPHHDGLIQRQERLGAVLGCDRGGRPLDPGHPWNRPASPPTARCDPNGQTPTPGRGVKSSNRIPR